MFTQIVFPLDFELWDVADYCLATRMRESEFVPESERRFRFVDRYSQNHPTWELVPRLDGAIAPEALGIKLDLPSDIKKWTDLSTTPPELEPLVLRLKEEAERFDQRSGSVRRRLPELICGAHCVFAPNDQAARAELINTTCQLLAAAGPIAAADPAVDVFDFDKAMALSGRALAPATRERLQTLAVRAFNALEVERRSEEAAKRDLKRAKWERIRLLVVGIEDGEVKFGVRDNASVVWAWSNEPTLVTVARREGADLVVQFPRSENRVLVSLRETLGPVVGPNRRTGGLLHVAAILRYAEASRRLGVDPEYSSALLEDGLVAADPNTPAVFGLSESGNLFGNLDERLPRSYFTAEQLQNLIRLALAYEDTASERLSQAYQALL